VHQQIFARIQFKYLPQANDLSNSSKLHATDELRAKYAFFEFGKMTTAATMLVMCQMQTPALTGQKHDGLQGLAYLEDWQKWVKPKNETKQFWMMY
jgi:hypothetical protein